MVMTMKKRRKINWKRLGILIAALVLIIALFVMLISMMFSGCSQKKDTGTEQTTEESKVQMVTMGDSKSGLTPVNIDNQTGQAIVSFKVKKAADADYGENLLGDNRIKNNATAQWFFDPGDSTWDVEIKLANYNTFVLHNIPFDKFNGMVSIKYRDEVGFLEYKPKGSETAVSTYNEEVDQKNKEAEQQTKQAQPADTQTTQDDAQTEDQTYDETYDETYDDGTYDEYYDTGYDDGTYDETYDYSEDYTE